MRKSSFLATALLFVAAAGVAQHEHHQHKPSASTAATNAIERVNIPDVMVRTQDGRTVHFYRDLIQGKVVAVNFIFTTCTTVCPPMGALFGQLQAAERERLGRDLFLISVSIDPVVDTPERLAAWGKKFGAKPGWTLVTGDKEDITTILKAMGVYVPSFQDHQPVTLIGNDSAGAWRRVYGFATARKLASLIDEVSVPRTARR